MNLVLSQVPNPQGMSGRKHLKLLAFLFSEDCTVLVQIPLSHSESEKKIPNLNTCRLLLCRCSLWQFELKLTLLSPQSCWTLCDLMDCSCQALLSMGFSRQKYWSGLLFPSPGDLPNSRIESRSPVLQADLYRLSHQGNSEGMKRRRLLGQMLLRSLFQGKTSKNWSG